MVSMNHFLQIFIHDSDNNKVRQWHVWPYEQQRLYFSVSEVIVVVEWDKNQPRALVLVFGLRLHSYDSVCNTFLIKECGLHPPSSEQYGLIVHSHSDFFGSIAFPAIAELGLRVNKLGKTSVTWEIGLFEQGVDEVKAVGEMVHVFVERKTGRPAVNGLHEELRRGLRKLLTSSEKLWWTHSCIHLLSGTNLKASQTVSELRKSRVVKESGNCWYLITNNSYSSNNRKQSMTSVPRSLEIRLLID